MNQPATEPASFEKALADLETIVQALDDGSTSLEEALNQYERGVGLLKFCYDRLQKAEQRIVQLTGVNEAGEPILESFEPSAGNVAPTKSRQGLRKTVAES